MRLSDLMGCDVIDAAGTRLGRVSDVHVVQRGGLTQGVQERFWADALLVGRGSWGERVGFIRGRARGPWLVAALFGWIERHARLIPCDEVAEWNVQSRVVRLRTVVGSRTDSPQA